MLWSEGRRLLADSWQPQLWTQRFEPEKRSSVTSQRFFQDWLQTWSFSVPAAHHVTQYMKFCTSGSTYHPSPLPQKCSPYMYLRNPPLLVCYRTLESSFGISGFCSCRIMLLDKLSPSISHISVGRKLELFHILAN